MKRNHIIFKNIAVMLTLAVCAIVLSAAVVNQPSDVLKKWKAGSIVKQDEVKRFGENNCFRVEMISDRVFKRMKGKSFPQQCRVELTDLRYIKTLHRDIDGNTKIGELVVNKSIADDVLNIFRQLYQHNYPIEKMVLIDNYDAIDERSMTDNNTSAFCYRAVAGSKTLSAHSKGLAVDINPLYNPYYKDLKNGKRRVQPTCASAYCNRNKQFKYKIEKGDLCHRLFTSKGFTWGGSWHSCKDFQHFERNLSN